MINIYESAGHTAYGNKIYVLDTEDDLKDLPITGLAPGSAALVISTSDVWMLNSKGEWKVL